MGRQPRATLPRMGRPYQGIQLLLELVASYNPSEPQLDELVREHQEDSLPKLVYLSGREDILFFCYRLLKLFDYDLCERRFRLSDVGRSLCHFLHTPEFGFRLFSHIVERSRESFTYFYSVYEALEMKALDGQFELPTRAFRSLVLERSNKHSSKEIQSLLFESGAIREQPDSIVIEPSFFSVDFRERQIEGLLVSTEQMILQYGRQVYPDLLARLRRIYPYADWDQLEDAFRARLIISRTRASEYVDGVRSST